MAIHIPEDTIIEIQNSCNIVDVVSESVRLKKSGSNWMGLCPFHSEKTPSFSVSPSKQMFYCFGCGEGGNVFGFVMKREGVSFPEAVEILARRSGIEIPTDRFSPEQQQHISERETILTINRQAADFFHSRLLNPKIGHTAKDYLLKRGITEETIQRFQIGYAPDGWDHILNFLSKNHFPPLMIEKSGLIAPRSGKDGYYDRFRNRIIFPISDIRSQIIGFGGRVMDDAQPKYLNSPETPVYNKSRSLYGLNLSRSKCRESDTVFIVEGYLDLIMMVQHGIENTAATLGTALTPEQVRLLKGFAGKMVLVYDSDEAGIRAALRSIEIFRKENIDARLMILPQGHDPDSFLRQFGAQAFMDSAQQALTIIEFLTETAIRKHGLSGDGKIRIVTELTEPLASVQDELAQAVYIRELSDRLQIDESLIRERVNAKNQKTAPTLIKTSVIAKPRNRFEEQIIGVMLHCRGIRPEIIRRRLLDYFEDQTLKSIGEHILRHENSTETDLINAFEDDYRKNWVASMIMTHERFHETDDRTQEGCLKLLDQFEQNRNRKHYRLVQELKAAEAGDNPEAVFSLLEKGNLRLKALRDKQRQRFEQI